MRLSAFILISFGLLGFCRGVLYQVGNPACFYVSPNIGLDTNSGTVTAPFLTLQKAQSAMAAGATKCVNVGHGIYLLSSAVALTSADNGEIWIANSNDAPLSAIIDGQGTVPRLFELLGASNVTLDGLVFRNMIYAGVAIHGGTATVNSVTFYNQTTGIASGNTVQNSEAYGSLATNTGNSDYFTSGLVSAEGDVPNTTVQSNYIHDMAGNGVLIWNNGKLNDDISNASIYNNVILNVNTVVSDDGAAYYQDILATSTNLSVNHNYISAYNTGNGIYLDQQTSNTTITNNIVRAGGTTSSHSTGLLYDCGSSNAISNNIIDAGSSAVVNGTIELKFSSGGCTAMTSDTWQKNIMLFGFVGNQNTSYYNVGVTYQCAGGTPAHLGISNNMYYNSAGGQALSTGACSSDSSPVFQNPIMADNYRVCTGVGVPVAGCPGASPALSAPLNFSQLAGGWGPPGFTIPGGY